MVYLKWSKHENVMTISGNSRKWSAQVSCVVRNELNGWRKLHEVVYTTPDEIPYQPRRFPTGVWKLGEPETETDPYLAPFFIPTDAWQMVEAWELKDGIYHQPTGRMVRDSGYGLHFSTSGTTIGCIKFHVKQDLINLVKELKESDDNKIEVTG